MRKLEYLRKEYKKLLKKNKGDKEKAEKAIYYIDLPTEFIKKGDYEHPVCLPYSDYYGICGIAVEHCYEYEDDIFTYCEHFAFRKIKSVFAKE